MTDEELSMEFVLNYPKIEKGELLTSKDLQNAYLAGLKASRPKWHKVADGDLPKEEAEYLVIFESDGTRYTGLESYYPDTKEWSTICNIIAWCEIPKFSE